MTISICRSLDQLHRLLPSFGLRVANKIKSEAVLGDDGHPEVEMYHIQKIA